jgi:TM2 domain-containing membrane protein YozV
VVLQGFYWKQPGNNIVIIPLLWLEILCLCDWFLHLQYCKLTNFYLWQLRFIGIGR